MERVVVFRFHRAPAVCRSRLALLRRLNPDVPVYGLGERIGLADEFEHLHVVDGHESRWKWMHGDLALRDWFRSVGRDVPFDVLHLVEWDLLPCEPLDALYGHVPADGVGLTGIRPMDEARADGWAWITRNDRPEQFRRLREHVARAFGYEGGSPSCVFPGVCLPREFLTAYADHDVPELCNDEVRVPLFARALGFDLHNTGFFDWTDEERRWFNCRNDEIPRARIDAELADPDGRRVFHPVRQPIEADAILSGVA